MQARIPEYHLFHVSGLVRIGADTRREGLSQDVHISQPKVRSKGDTSILKDGILVKTLLWDLHKGLLKTKKFRF